MSGRVFLDTNVLVYTDDTRDAKKRARAQRIVKAGVVDGAVVSTQVLQEYFVSAKKIGVPLELARHAVLTFAKLDVVPISVELIVEAIDLHRTRSLSFWDALIVRAAVAGGCKRVLTEDMQDGAVIDGVTIENPFT